MITAPEPDIAELRIPIPPCRREVPTVLSGSWSSGVLQFGGPGLRATIFVGDTGIVHHRPLYREVVRHTTKQGSPARA
ncbi:hypothetical protein [Amycolatopsis speibonae]|uniref:Uncharacterized protein n=1 Tax=Amycolatopsis speibonae TaxID=1450224 RepID=A0ABV7P451_9PSEU